MDLLEGVKALSRYKSKLAAATLDVAQGFIADLAETFMVFWEASKRDERWDEHGGADGATTAEPEGRAAKQRPDPLEKGLPE